MPKNEQFNIEQIDTLSINDKLNKLSAPENSLSIVLDEIGYKISNMSEENKQLLITTINEIFSQDPNIMAKGDFLGTLEKIKKEIA